jgi:phage shock protein PspC (stress-responsive transcriptional regulator)
MSVFEIIMLLCFGAAWPVSLWKSWTSRTNAGKSVVYLFIIVLGYAAGIAHKLIDDRDLVTLLYALNMTMVSADIVLWFRNDRLDRRTA